MTAPTPSPEEFAKTWYSHIVYGCERDAFENAIDRRDASLTAPLREEVERLREALRPFAAIQPTPTMPDGDKFVIVWDGSLLWADVDPKIVGAWSGVTAADLRAAARALAEGQP